jgi:GMP synthase-like glutamine amidotransferase
VQNITREGPGILRDILDTEQIAYDLIDLDKGQVFPDPTSYKAVVVLGGPDSANDITPKMSAELARIAEIIDAGIPYLGVCLGLQTLVKAAGGSVIRNPVKEIGFIDPEGQSYTIDLTPEGQNDPLFQGLPSPLKVFHLHGETVEIKPEYMQLLGTGKHCQNQVVRVGANAYGLQCHFEMTREILAECADKDPDLQPLGREAVLKVYDEIKADYTKTGETLLRNFLKIAKVL